MRQTFNNMLYILYAIGGFQKNIGALRTIQTGSLLIEGLIVKALHSPHVNKFLLSQETSAKVPRDAKLPMRLHRDHPNRSQQTCWQPSGSLQMAACGVGRPQQTRRSQAGHGDDEMYGNMS